MKYFFNIKANKVFFKGIGLLLAILFPNGLLAQFDSVDFEKYSFIHEEKNVIHNDEILYPFFNRLENISYHNFEVVTIVHIGNSHIQAGFFSGRIREYLQIKYGNAGRGLVFPGRIAGTNDAFDIRSYSPNRWQIKRIVNLDNPLPIGICGYTLHTKNCFQEINIAMKNRLIDYSFNKIKIFNDKNDKCYDWAVFDKENNKLGFVNNRSTETNSYTSTIELDRLIDEITLTNVKTSPVQNYTNFYGISFENHYPGILYHTIGVNGATTYHYNQSRYFPVQFSALEPNLVIISLGSNEALNPPFFKKFFRTQLELFIKSIKIAAPKASIIFTTPPDSYLKKRMRNRNVERVRNSIVEFCEKNNIAYWDLYEIMGGYSSIESWIRSGLVQNDKIHFKAKGYYMQSTLFLQAFEKSLKKYREIGNNTE